jgi:hypothetical protein
MWNLGSNLGFLQPDEGDMCLFITRMQGRLCMIRPSHRKVTNFQN